MKSELTKGLSDDQLAKLNACKSGEDILRAAKEEGIELNDEQLAAVTGGGCGGEDSKKKGEETSTDQDNNTGHPITNPF